MQAEAVGVAGYLLQRSIDGFNVFLAAVRVGRSIGFLERLDHMFTTHLQKHPDPGWHRRNSIGDGQSALHWAAINECLDTNEWLLGVDPGLQACVNSEGKTAAAAMIELKSPPGGTVKADLEGVARVS